MHNPFELISKPWAIDQLYARAWYPVLLQMFERSRTVVFGGQPISDNREMSESRKKSRPYLYVAGYGSKSHCDVNATVLTLGNDENDFGSSDIKEISYQKLKEAPAGSIAVIPITGPITKEDGLSSLGTESKGEFLKQVYDSPNITGVVLKISSGGGEVAGTMAFADIIKQRNKPIVAYGSDMVGSAAYWIAMNADRVIINDPTTQVGSIGVMMTLMDDTAYWESMGINWVNITAKGSEDKNKPYFDALNGKIESLRKESLNPLREMFADAVLQARGNKIDLESENVLSGKIYFGTETAAGNKSALSVGLADSIGNFDFAVSSVLQLAETGKYKKQKPYSFI